MENASQKKSLIRTMRALHRDIGFLLIGLTFIYCASGIVLIYRDQGFLKYEEHVEKTVALGLDAKSLPGALQLRRMKVERQDGDIIYFDNGQYDAATGKASYTQSSYPWIIDKFHSLHLAPSNSVKHLFGVVYGSLLLFLAVSALFMYRPGTRYGRRGLTLASAGVVAAIIIVVL